MNREEVKKELLNDNEIQFQSAITATFIALYQQLIKKEIFTDKDVDEINENTKKIVDTIKETLIDEIMKVLESCEDEWRTAKNCSWKSTIGYASNKKIKCELWF